MTLEEALQIGLSHHQAGKLAEAEAIYRQVLAAAPNHPDALNLLGVLAGQAGRHELAIEFLGRAIAVAPRTPQFYLHLGVSLHELGNYDQAAAAYQNALSLNPNYPQALTNLGNTLAKMGDALYRQGRLEESTARFHQAVALRPDSSDALINLGTVLAAQGQVPQAAIAFARAAQLSPQSAEAHWNLALMHLTAGDFANGFREYESRFSVKEFAGLAGPPESRWNGGDLTGQWIVLHAEQGLGDVIQFIRYAPMVAARGARIIVAAHRELHRLLRQMSPVEEWLGFDDPLPPHDLHCPLMSLPGIFQTTPATIPASIPYLHADADLKSKWQARIANHRGLKIGLCWAGRASHRNDRNRSIPIEEFDPLLRLPKATFFSLQKDAINVPAAITDWTAELTDLAETAALISNLDLVITADTAVAHLAGAMGVRTWLLLPFLPDWRWMLNRTDSPWYPTMRLFRQDRPGHWAAPIATILAALKSARQPEATHDHGLRLLQTGHPQQAAQILDLAVLGDPKSPSFKVSLGVALQQSGLVEQAAATYRKALLLDKNNAPALCNLSSALIHLQRPDEALEVSRQAVDSHPHMPEAFLALGIAQKAVGDTIAAALALRAALELRPDYPDASSTLAAALLHQHTQGGADRLLDEAVAQARRALHLRPDMPEALCNLGLALLKQYEQNGPPALLDEAIPNLSRDPLPQAATALIHALDLKGNFANAIEVGNQIVAVAPEDAVAHWYLGMLLLKTGHLPRGWIEYESRLSVPQLALAAEIACPRWDGAPLDGRAILLYPEQGYGDAIQFARYIPLVAAQSARVILHARPELRNLFRHSFPTVQWLDLNDPLPECDVHSSLLSLPAILKTSLTTLPPTIPYLTVDPAKAEHWRARLAGETRRKIGIAWAGRLHPDPRRSLPPDLLAPLAAIPNTVFVSLQKKDPLTIDTFAPPLPLLDWTADLADFSDTAALIQNLDEVLTIDTAVAHLAGALGKPTWTLLPHIADWRWMLDRSDSPWYPTMKLFRQPGPDQWTPVVAEVMIAMNAFQKP